MKLRTLIIDDEPIALEKLKTYVSKVPFLELVAQCGSGIEAIDFMAKEKQSVDLIITDINMPDLNGMEFLNTLVAPPLVIFTTAYSEYAVESYKFAAVDYLLKPYSFPDFQRAVNRALERSSKEESNPSEPSIFVKVDYRYVRIDFSDICYIKGYGEYLQIFVDGSSSPLVTLSSFASIRERLSDKFLQVHRSYIVNMDRIQRVERSRIFMANEEVIPIGDSYRDNFFDYLSTRSIGKIAR